MHDSQATSIDRQLIFTADADAAQIALSELQSLDPYAELIEWLAPGIGRLALSMSWGALTHQMRRHPPVFCRHICPVQVHVPVHKHIFEPERLAHAALSLLPHLRAGQSFSVQTRLLGEDWSFGRYDVNTRLSEEIAAQEIAPHGLPLDVRNPQQVLSAVLVEGHGYLGVSRTRDNLSAWAGGERRFRREKEQISRAEFKLLEAVELFDLTFPGEGLALDLGAAPGGWTRVLRQHGLRVIAVDPADLDARLAHDPGIEHARELAQNYLQHNDARYDVILNDMRMDARDSARLTLAAIERLAPHGWALMTLKLPEGQMAQVASEALALLGQHATIRGARQLFHNRSEITVALGHKGGR